MIIDTSVVVKWFYEEAETSTALCLFDKIANHYCGRKTFSYCRGAGNTIITRL